MRDAKFTAETLALIHLFEVPLRDELRWQLRKLRGSDVFIDVGACVGTSSLLIDKGTCFAFEFDHEAIVEMRRNLKLNPEKNVTLVEAAVSNKVFGYEIHHKERIGDSYLSESKDTNAPKTITLDDYFKGYRHIKLIKVDAEGEDYNVLLGAGRILRNNRPVVVAEAWNEQMNKQITSYLTNLGYRIRNVGINVVGEYLLSKRRLEVTTKSSCVVDCTFCPQEVFRQAYDSKTDLTLDTFKVVLKNVPKDVVIEFAGFSEPFLNSECVSMVQYADSEGYRIIIDTTLTGLTPEGVEAIADCDLLAFSLHLPDNKGNTRIPYNTQIYKDTLTACLTKIRVDSFVVMNDNFVNNWRAGNCEGAPKRNLRGLLACRLEKLEYPQPVMLPNGDLVLCCMDWQLTSKLGNLLESPYDELTDKIYKIELCRRCTYADPLAKHLFRKVSWNLYRKIMGVEK